MNERDSAKMDEMVEVNKANAAATGGGGGRGDGVIASEGDAKPDTLVEVANVRVGSMVRMATVDK